MTLSALSFTAMNLLVKYLVGFSAYQLVFFRSLGTLFFTTPFLIYHKISPIGTQRVLLVYRALAGVFTMGLFFMSVRYLSIGSAVALRYVSPIFATLLAVFYLKERVVTLQWLFIIVAFCGVLLIKGFDNNMSSIGLVLALLSAFFSGVGYVIINKIGKGDHPVVIINYFMCIAVLIGGVGSIFYWNKTPEGIELIVLLSLGVFGYTGQLFMTKSFQSQTTNKMVPLKYMEVVFTMIAAIFLFGDVYPLLSILGTAMVVTALIFIVVYKPKTPSNYKGS